MKKLEILTKTYVVSYLCQTESVFLMAVIPSNDYDSDNSVQTHFTGQTLEEVIENAFNSLISD